MTPEELVAQEAAKVEEAKVAEATKAEAEAAKAKELESIPEAFRGKSQKELVELVLNTSTELERHKEAIRQKELEIEQLKPKPQFDQLSEVEKKALKEKEFIADPVGYLEKHHAERMKPIADEYYKGQSEIQLQLLKGDKERYPDFATFEKPIRAYLDQMPVEVRSNPAAIDWAYKMSEYPELKKRLKEGSAREGLHSEGEGSPPLTKPEKRVLDEEEKVVAAKFGLTEEDYVKFSKKGSIDDYE